VGLRGVVVAAIASIVLGCAAGEVARPKSTLRRPVARAARQAPSARTAHILLDLSERRVHLMPGAVNDPPGTPLGSFPVAIGRQEYATPTGRFQVLEKLIDPDFLQFDWTQPGRVVRRIPPGPANPLGKRWIGFTTAHGWGIGFHGTPKPELLGQAVSHGCVRMRNDDIVWLFDRVDLGTPVVVRQ
jgi:lipoprotein-anchoring transpeptidase ErfK/SrfK